MSFFGNSVINRVNVQDSIKAGLVAARFVVRLIGPLLGLVGAAASFAIVWHGYATKQWT